MNSWSSGKTAALGFLSCYRLVFIALSIDIIVRVWGMRGGFDSPIDLLTLLFIEGLRSLVTACGIILSWRAAAHARAGMLPAALAFAISFATIAYTKVMTYHSFPGAVQEELAKMFVRWNVPLPLLRVVFAEPEWAAWLMLAAVAVFAAHYPRSLTAQDVLDSGARDRAGALRNTALAGADVGSILRRWTSRRLESGDLAPRRLWLTAAAIAVVHTAIVIASPESAQPYIQLIAAAVAGLFLAVCVTLHRASALIAKGQEKYVLDWLRRGAVAGVLLFLLSGAALMIPRTVAIGFVGLSIAPAALMLGVAASLARPIRHSPG